jgi:hypothetical protein
MNQQELTEMFDSALVEGGEASVRALTDNLLANGGMRERLMFARYCRDFLANTDKYDLIDTSTGMCATPEQRASLHKAWADMCEILEAVSTPEVEQLNSILGDIVIDL